jgi:hypothetical protein
MTLQQFEQSVSGYFVAHASPGYNLSLEHSSCCLTYKSVIEGFDYTIMILTVGYIPDEDRPPSSIAAGLTLVGKPQRIMNGQCENKNALSPSTDTMMFP